jgi:hypothetical protein
MGAPGLALREGRHGEGAKRNVDRCTTGRLLLLGNWVRQTPEEFCWVCARSRISCLGSRDAGRWVR